MHADLRGTNFEQVAQVGVHGVLQKIAALAIVVEHLAQMVGKMALVLHFAWCHLGDHVDKWHGQYSRKWLFSRVHSSAILLMHVKEVCS